jgi:two-component system chemotaxis response regulator CheY
MTGPLQALVVDDSRAMRSVLRRILEGFGARVEEAPDGAAALARLRAGPCPHVALVDWNMPTMDGVALVRAVRADPALAGLRVVMVTSETEMDHVATALEAGADEYVMKPFTPDALREKLELLDLVGG